MLKSFIADEESIESISFDRCACGSSINNYIDNNKNENKFQTLLFKYIDYTGLSWNKLIFSSSLLSFLISEPVEIRSPTMVVKAVTISPGPHESIAA